MAIRSVPTLVYYCTLAREVANPGHLIFNFTNPSGIITQALRSKGFDNVYGICDAPSGFIKQLEEILEIPYGTVTTYGALARTLRGQGISAAAQAVGGAVGHNPISILIPCHRVVGSDGRLTGYAGGVANKQFLLELEGVDMTGLYVPTRGTAL